MKEIKVIDLGGSIVAPDEVAVEFLTDFKKIILDWLNEDKERKIIFVVGGGGPARKYQQGYRALVETPDHDEQDWIGIMATRLNGQLLKAVFQDLCKDAVVYDPTGDVPFTGRVLVGAGWKPGFSTDYDAVLLAKQFGASSLINLSNIAKVYTADPKLDPDAKPIDKISWAEFKKIVGDEWIPGKNTPFDPVATKEAADMGLKILVGSGSDLDNFKNMLYDRDFDGTIIE